MVEERSKYNICCTRRSVFLPHSAGKVSVFLPSLKIRLISVIFFGNRILIMNEECNIRRRIGFDCQNNEIGHIFKNDGMRFFFK